MRAAVLTEFNKDWQFQTLPDPRPAPGQVLIRIHASGMCGTDLHAHHGHLGAKLPIVLGHEPAGEIVELGAGRAGPEGRRSRRRVLESEGGRALRRLSGGAAGALSERAELDEPGRRQLGADAGLGLGLRADSRRALVRAGGAAVLRRVHGDERPAQRRAQTGRAGGGAGDGRPRAPGPAAEQGGRSRDVRDHRPGRQEGGAEGIRRRRGVAVRRRSRPGVAGRGRRGRDSLDDQLGQADLGGVRRPAPRAAAS